MPETIKAAFQLTPEQEQALVLDAHIIVDAGAGAGKTSILAQRFVKILQEQPELDPSRILAITFTNKAAGEMLAKIRQFIKTAPLTRDRRQELAAILYRAQITTIHAFCATVLRQQALVAGLDPKFSILETESASFLMHKAVEQVLLKLQKQNHPALDFYLRDYTYANLQENLLTLLQKQDLVRNWQNHYLAQAADDFTAPYLAAPAEELAATKTSFSLLQALLQIHAECQNQYQALKQKNQQLDYNDLLFLTRDLLATQPAVVQQLGQQFKYVMVDEFQDTDRLQWEIIRYVAGQMGHATKAERANLFIVGDIKQSIYSFRGAEPDLFQQLSVASDQLADTRRVRLAENFRTQPPLIDFINGFFGQLFGQQAENYNALRAMRTETTGRVEFAFLPSSKKTETALEMAFAARWIKQLLAEQPTLRPKDVALLVRRKKNMGEIRDALVASGLQVHLHAARDFYDEPVIRDALALLGALAEPLDQISWLCVLKSPIFRLSDEGLFLLFHFYPDLHVPAKLQACAHDPHLDASIWSAPDLAAIRRAAELMPLWQQDTNFLLPADLLLKVYRDLTPAQAGATQLEPQIKSLTKKLRTLEKNGLLAAYPLPEIIARLKTSGAGNDEEIANSSPDAVNVLSIHAAKGLEFPVVIIPECGKTFNFARQDSLIINRQDGIGISYKGGATANQNLHKKALSQTQEEAVIAEEKRILYVSSTRARDYLLYLGCCPRPAEAEKTEKPTKKSKAPVENKMDSYLNFFLSCAQPDTTQQTLTFNFAEGRQGYGLGAP